MRVTTKSSIHLDFVGTSGGDAVKVNMLTLGDLPCCPGQLLNEAAQGLELPRGRSNAAQKSAEGIVGLGNEPVKKKKKKAGGLTRLKARTIGKVNRS